MKKTMYNKKGFTLAEMLLVIGIIVILSGATAIGVISWVNNAKNTAANLEANNGDHFEQEALESVKKIAGTAGSHVINQTNLDTPAPTTPKPTTKPTQNNDNDPTPVPATPTPVPATPTPEPTPTTAPDNGGGNGGGNSGGGNVTVSSATTTQQGTSTPGVVSYSVSGNTVNVQLYAGNNNSDASSLTNITITKQKDGKYLVDFSPAGDKYWICNNCGISADDYYNGKKTKVMTADEINAALKMNLK